jgi:F0F1-type ATP synthase membrane subunit b/b'
MKTKGVDMKELARDGVRDIYYGFLRNDVIIPMMGKLQENYNQDIQDELNEIEKLLSQVESRLNGIQDIAEKGEL